MKTIHEKGNKGASGRSRGRRGSCTIIKTAAKLKKGKKLASVVRYSKSDAQMLIRLINRPFEPNEAVREAKLLNAAVPRLSVGQHD